MPQIKFLIIGAQKSASTSLYMYLREHPQVFMPSRKEVEFFSNDIRFSKGKEWYMKTFFLNSGDKVCGEASTYYMYFRAVPKRIASLFPEVKLIAILRNPIDRCYSHYLMAARRGHEKRKFREAIKDLADTRIDFPYSADAKYSMEQEANYYLIFGQYAQALKEYLKFFNKDKMLLLFTEELEKDPAQAMKKVYRFLEVDSLHQPRNLGKKYFASGKNVFSPFPRQLKKQSVIFKEIIKFLFRGRKILDTLKEKKATFKFWLEQHTVKPAPYPKMTEEDKEFLKNFYQNDINELKRMFSINVPWEEFD